MTVGARHRVGIVGGGFTGAVCAVHLANAASVSLAIDVIEPRERLGAGLAYGSCEPEHRINVPSDRMTVFKEDPLHFTRWLKRTGAWDADQQGLTGSGDHYSTRRDFGAYIADLVDETAAGNRSSTTIRHKRTTARGLTRAADGWQVALDDGSAEVYDDVVLCTTYAAPPFRWALTEGAERLPHLVRNPWDWNAIKAIPHDAMTVVIGTGLTMCDAVVTLRANGHRGKILAVSRRALTPRPHGEFDGTFDIFQGREPPKSAIGLLRLVRTQIRDLAGEGRTWHVVVDSLRRWLATYWTTLPVEERIKIVRKLRAYWDVHRFRIAPQVAAMITRGQGEGWLEISAGRIHAITSADARFGLDWTRKSGSRSITVADAIINCTGPDPDLRRSENPLLNAAMMQGLIRPDALRIGVDVDAEGRLLGRSGGPTPGLWAAGPFARAVVGEATGVPEASSHARHVAEALAAAIAAPAGVRSRRAI